MKIRLARSLAALTLAFAGLGPQAHAGLSYTASVGGSAFDPPGYAYATFNSLSLGSAGGTDGGVSVAFANGATVVGSTDQHAAPEVSGDNNKYFGGNYIGDDSTHYLTTGGPPRAKST